MYQSCQITKKVGIIYLTVDPLMRIQIVKISRNLVLKVWGKVHNYYKMDQLISDIITSYLQLLSQMMKTKNNLVL